MPIEINGKIVAFEVIEPETCLEELQEKCLCDVEPGGILTSLMVVASGPF